MLLLLLYTFAGFLLSPWIIRKQLTSFVEEDIQLELDLGKVKINPWTLTAEIQQFVISEPGGKKLLGFNRLFVNFQTVSLFKWAFTFKNVFLEQPSAAIVLNNDGTLNLEQLIPPIDAEAESGTPPDEEAKPLRWLINNLSIVQGDLMFSDESRPVPFHMILGPIDIELTDLNTLPGLPGDQTVFLSAGDGTSIEWTGDIQLNPFSTEGHLNVSGAYVQLTHDYFQHMLNFTVEDAALALGFDYSIKTSEAGLTAELDNATLEISNLDLKQNSRDNTATDLVSVSFFKIEDASYTWPDNALTIRAIGLTQYSLIYGVPMKFRSTLLSW